ncbi:hypothetical protein DFQ30_011482, partial [Apophysomyces sp. BC1015]
MKLQSHASIECRRRLQVEHAGGVAEQARRDVQQQLVDAALAQQRAIERVAGFDVQLVDAALGEQVQRGRQIDLAGPIRQREHFRTGCAQRMRAWRELTVIACADHERRRAGQDSGAQRHVESAVDQHAQRLARRIHRAYRHVRVVLAHRADAGEDRACAGAPCMPVSARGAGGDPLALAARQCGAPVQCRRELEPDPRNAARHPRHETDIQLLGLVREQPAAHVDARVAQ